MKHKTALATAASVSGLLLASAAAMGANLGILQSGDETFGSLSATGSTSSISTNPPVPVVGRTPMSSTIPEGATIYQVPDVADITLVPTADGGLQVLGVVTVSGWSAAVQPSDTGVQIELASATDTLEFKASLIDGRIQALVERASTGSSDTVPAAGSGDVSRSVSGPTPSTVSTPTTAVRTANPGGTTYTDDDHSYDDHSDDHHGGDGHGGDDHGGDDHTEYEGGGDDD